MASSRFWQIVGVAGAGGAGYYLYNAGGSPKVAEKRFEGKMGTPTPQQTPPPLLIHVSPSPPLPSKKQHTQS